jgi:hypothetical protein
MLRISSWLIFEENIEILGRLTQDKLNKAKKITKKSDIFPSK